MLTDQPTAIDGWTRSPLTGADRRRHLRGLGTTDHAEALQIVTRQSKPRNGASVPARHDSLEALPQVTLARLWERYRRECETFRDTDQTHQSDAATRAAILIGYFGADYDVEHLSKDAQRRYERARAAGGLRYRHERRVVRFGRVRMETVVRVAQATRARSAEADLVPLHAMLNWATTARGKSSANHAPWLHANPLKGIERRPEKNPRRARDV
jgi:hypothetical protein